MEEDVTPHQGEKMIELVVRFWTDTIAPPGKVRKKHGLTGGFVRIRSNKTHGIKGQKAIPFNSLPELGGVIENVLILNGIKLFPTCKARKYLQQKEK